MLLACCSLFSTTQAGTFAQSLLDYDASACIMKAKIRNLQCKQIHSSKRLGPVAKSLLLSPPKSGCEACVGCAGDRLNFGLAVEQAKTEGYKV